MKQKIHSLCLVKTSVRLYLKMLTEITHSRNINKLKTLLTRRDQQKCLNKFYYRHHVLVYARVTIDKDRAGRRKEVRWPKITRNYKCKAERNKKTQETFGIWIFVRFPYFCKPRQNKFRRKRNGV
jgi:hypothetical protein